MFRFMLDSDTPDALNQGAELVMTYSDLVPSPEALRRLVAPARLILIDRGLGDPSGLASVFDIERGTLTIAEAVAKYDAQLSAGIPYLTVYVNRDNIQAVRDAFSHRTPWMIVATLDGTSHIAGIRALHGPAAIQCLNATDLGIHADGSLVFEDAWNPTDQASLAAGVLTQVNHARRALASAGSDLSQAAVLIGG